MGNGFRKICLTGCAVVALACLGASGAFAACATTGQIAADCDLQSDPTGDITIDNGVTVTLDGNLALGFAIDGDSADGQGILATAGTGVAIGQTEVIGGTQFTLDSLTVSGSDTWDSSADITVENALTIDGALSVDGSGGGVTIDSTAATVDVGAGGSLSIDDSTNTVSIGLSNGIQVGGGGTVSVNDGNDVVLWDLNGAAAGLGTLAVNDDYTLQGDVGAVNALSLADVGAGFVLTTDGYALKADDIAVGAGSGLHVTNSSTAEGLITLGAGAALVSSDGSQIYGGITGDGGAQTIDLVNGETLGQAGDAIDLGGGDDQITVDGLSSIAADTLGGGLGDDTVTSNADTDITADVTGFENFDVADGVFLTFGGDVDGGTVSLGDGASLEVYGAGKTAAAAVEGASGAAQAQTVTATDGTLSGAVNLYDGADTVNLDGGDITGAVDMGDGDDTLNALSSVLVGAASIDGGAGTDLFHVQADIEVAGDLSGFEDVDVDDGVTLLLDGDVDGGIVTLGDTSVLEIAGGTVSADVSAATGGGESQSVTVSSGVLEGDTDLGDGADTVTLAGGAITGTVDFGDDSDTLVLTSDGEAQADMAGLETVDAGGNVFTVTAAISGLDGAFGGGIDVNAGTLVFNGSGAADGAIFDSNGAGSGLLEFGGDGNGGTFTLAGIVDDVSLTVTSGTLDTGGFLMGANELLGAVSIMAGGVFNVEDSVQSGGVLTNAGHVVIGNGGALTVDSTAAAGGTFTFVVNGAADFGTLTVSNGAFDMTGATVEARTDVDNLADGDEVMIVDGSASVIGKPAAARTLIADNIAGWKFYLMDGTQAAAPTDDTDLFLSAEEVSYAERAYPGNNAAAAVALAALSGTADPQLQEVLANLDNAGSDGEFNELLESLQPAADGGDVAAARDIAGAVAQVTRSRMAALRSGIGTGVSTGSAMKGLRVWGQGFGRVATQDGRGGVDGYRARIGGAAVGADTRDAFDDAGFFGLSFSYAHAAVDSRSAAGTDTGIDSYGATMYGGFEAGDAGFVNASAGYAWNSVDTVRHDVGGTGLDARGDYTGHQFFASAAAGRDFRFRGLNVTPAATLDWTHYRAGDYTETGAGGAGLHVERGSAGSLMAGLSLDLAAKYSLGGGYIVPHLHAGYKYDLLAKGLQTTSGFAGGGPAFRTESPDPAKGHYEAGADLKLYTPGDWEIWLGYDYSFRDDYSAHDAILRATCRL